MPLIDTSITPHPDTLTDHYRLKQIRRGSMQAIEDKAIEQYMRVFEEKGREAAEKTFFKHFNKGYGLDKHKRSIA